MSHGIEFQGCLNSSGILSYLKMWGMLVGDLLLWMRTKKLRNRKG